MKELTKEDYEEFIKQKGKVILEFKASWCGDCARVKDTFERLSKRYEDQVKFGRVDIDAEKELHEKYKITSIPDFRFFINGEEVKKFVEPSSFELEENINRFLSI